MKKDDNFRIHVKAGGFLLPMTIARDEEEVYRKAERILNKVLLRNQQKQSNRSAEEVLSITAYQLALALSKVEFVQNAEHIVDKIKQLDKELDDFLAERK